MTGSKPVALPLGDAPTEHPDMTVCLRMGAHYIGCSPRIGHCLALKFNRPLRTRHGVEQRRAVAALGDEVLPPARQLAGERFGIAARGSSEERRVGEAWVSKGRSRGAPMH